MPRIGVSITKSTAFRNSTQEFSNVYYYEVVSEPTVAQADQFIDQLTTIEKTFHGTNVTFLRGRVWTETGNKATNNMISQKQLSGTGARSPNTNLDKERAWLFRLRAGVSSTGQPVYLRKWYHACAEFVAGASIPTNVLTNTGSFTQAERNAQTAAIAGIGDAGGGLLAAKLCAKSGRQSTAGETWQAHNFLEHHQFGDQWRSL
jgi:hypothetical protein